jgi:hypothetical protein
MGVILGVYGVPCPGMPLHHMRSKHPVNTTARWPEPLACSLLLQVGPSPNAKAMALPARCPAVARKLFVACTQMDPERRPCAQQLVEWLRADIAQSRH